MGGTRKTKDKILPIRPLENGHVKMAEREAFAQWLVMPPDEREPRTQAALAKELGVTPVILSNWKANQSFMRAVYKSAGRSMRLDWLEPILKHQYAIAISRSAKPSESTHAAKFLMSVMEKTMDLDDALEDAQRPIESMSLDELRVELSDIVDLIDDKIDLKI